VSGRPVRPARVAHLGVVEAAGLAFDAAILGEAEARRRAVTGSSPGSSLVAEGARIALIFGATRAIDASRAPGAPLVRARGALVAAPLDGAELDAIAPPPGAIVIVEGGVSRALEGAAPLDPATLLDVDAFEIVEAASLGPAPRPAPAARPPEVDARAALGLPPPPPAALAVAAALRGTGSPPRSSPSRDLARGAGLAASRLVARALGAIATLASLLARLAQRAAAPLPRDSAGPPRADGTPPRDLVLPPRGPSPAERFAEWLRRLAASLVSRTRLADLLGRAQARWLAETLELFEQRRFDEALRRAVPLGEGGGSKPPALSVPRARADLAIAPARGRATSSLGLGGALFDDLRAVYRRAYGALDRAGRTDEAAFVLAELLGANEEAVAYLERAGRLELAARVAEARRLPAEIVVRQWMLAGDVARATRIARAHGAFEAAVAKLARSGADGPLRVAWAGALAEAGDFAAAVEVAWPVAEARLVALAWIEAGLAAGGVAAARLLARKLAVVPGSFADVRAAALALAAREDDDAVAERRALAEALCEGPRTAEARSIARAVARALLADRGATGSPPLHLAVDRLVKLADDGALRSDVPAVDRASPRPALASASVIRRVDIAAADAGAAIVHDVAPLPGGRVALALGEAGVRVVSRDGRTLFALSEPAHRLVPSTSGARALALARRGEATRVARLDLAARRAEVWTEAILDAHAREFDGLAWIVGVGRALHVVDAAEPRFEPTLTCPLDGPALAVARCPGGAAAIVRDRGRDGDGAERWWWQVPGFTLRDRTTVADPAKRACLAAIGTHGSAAIARRTAPTEDGELPKVELLVWIGGQRGRVEIGPPGAEPIAVEATGPFYAVALRVPGAVRVALVDTLYRLVRMEITLVGATRVALRLGPETLAIGDDRGRALVIDLGHGDVLRDLRVV
jgi:hypothetical protein